MKVSMAKFFGITLGLIPLITWGGFYEGPKVWFLILVGASVAIYLIVNVLILKSKLVFLKSDVYFLLWLVVLTISGITNGLGENILIGGSYRHQGILFFLSLILISQTVRLISGVDLRFLNKCLAFSVLTEVLIVFYEYVKGDLYFNLPLGTLGEANALAGFFAIGSIIALPHLGRVFYILPVIALIMTESRAGLIALIPNVFLLISNLKSYLRKLIFLGAGLSILVMVFTVTEKKLDSEFEDRNFIWKSAAEAFYTQPVIGYGPESGEIVFNNAFVKRQINLEGLVIDRAHNLFLDVLMWTGFIGFFLFVLYLKNRYLELKNIYSKTAFWAFLIFAMFQPLSVVHWLLFFLL